MSGSKKTRPIDNSHCFRGLGLPYWRDMARGLQPVFASGRDGHYIDYQTDKMDGFAIQNGGLSNPSQRPVSGRTLVRFMAARADVSRAMGGHWWIDHDSFVVIRDWARAQSVSLSVAAQRLLVVPKSWNDCGALLLARPRGQLMAWVGKGQPVGITDSGGKFSPDGRTATGGRPPGAQVLDAPPDSNIEQYFIPGNDLAGLLVRISDHRILADGRLEPPLG